MIETHKELREFINKKFGSMRAFAVSTGQEKGYVNSFLYRSDENISDEGKKRIAAMYSLAVNTEKNDPKTFTEDEKAALKILAERVYGTAKQMEADNIGVSYQTAWKLWSGVLYTKSRKARRVISRLIDKAELLDTKLNSFEQQALSTLKRLNPKG